MAKKETVSKDVQHLYTEEYFMGSATGHDEFRTFNGKYDQLLDKFQMVVETSETEKHRQFP